MSSRVSKHGPQGLSEAAALRSVTCEGPIPRHGDALQRLLPSEESASLFLWAWPGLLGWRHAINWLFSPVVGNKTYPGDLWGIDSKGDLLIVETKLDRKQAQDPFEDFVAYGSSRDRAILWQEPALRERWSRLIAQEEKFIRDRAPALQPERPLTGTCRGILPYSSHRDAIWRWQNRFRSRITPQFDDGGYRRAVERSLRCRAARGNPAPFFSGLIASEGPRRPQLSATGKQALRALESRVRPEHAFLRALQVRAERVGGIRIECWTEEHAAS